jgi:hypothetical protein
VVNSVFFVILQPDLIVLFMKKILIVLVLLLVIAAAWLYVFVPTELKVSSIRYIDCPDNAAGRFLSDDNQWKQWWPTGKAGTNVVDGRSVFIYNRDSFAIVNQSFNGVMIATSFAGRTINGSMAHAKTTNDSLAVVWQYTVALSKNPVARMKDYFAAGALKKNTGAILDSLKDFLEKTDKRYGIAIKEIRVTDTVLISRYFESATQPSMATVYQEIETLKKFAAANGVQETGFPMLNTTMLDSTHYKTRVAIPIEKAIKAAAGNEIKRMIPGRILVTEIKGGPSKIAAAFLQLRYYQLDNDLSSPAIPFESLITNRLQEKDTANWITRIYYPIL